jgi:bifunctional NMN adenylyltransferase/nudix hydrolase
MNTQRIPGVGVVVGRFQTPYLHEGHLAVLEEASKHEKLMICVGVHRAPGAHANELDFQSRHLMLREEFPDAIIVPIKDEQQDDYWSKKLDGMIADACPIGPVVIYHGRSSFAPHYHGKYNLADVEVVAVRSGTELRKVAYTQPLNSLDFRRGIFYSQGNIFPRVNPCVDMAVMRWMPVDGDKNNLELCVALGNREADQSRWRFPGGHVDQEDSCNEHAARREVHEELSVEINDPEYIGSRKILDWRDTKTNTIMTNFYYCTYMFGQLKGDDDIHEARWFPVNQLKSLEFAGEHAILVDMLLEYIEKNKLDGEPYYHEGFERHGG